MKGIILDERKFCWFNDNDAWFIFKHRHERIMALLTPDQLFYYSGDSTIEEFNKGLFEDYDHVIVTADEKIFAVKGDTFDFLAEGKGAYECAQDIE